jgi:hypothetical protein
MRTLILFALLLIAITTGFSRGIDPRSRNMIRPVANGDTLSRRDSIHRYKNTIDTNYIRKYPDRFIVTLSQSYRAYDIRFTQTMNQDSLNHGAPQMMADANVVTGVAIDFDKISFSFGLRSAPPSDDVIRKKGKTKYTSLGLSFSFYRFRFECSYRRYNGFYDNQSPLYMPGYDTAGVFYQNPSMDVRSMRVKSLFIFNKRRFSYSAAYFNTQRQLKSAGSLLIVSNLYDYWFSADTSLIPPVSRPFYDQYRFMNSYRVQGFSVGPGYSFNLVFFKTFYINATLTSGFDFQHRKITTSDNSYELSKWKVGAAADFRVALGLNGKRLFSSITYRVDYNSYVNTGMHIEPRYHSFDFNIGYRFRMKRGRMYRKLNENRWYQLI